MKWLRFALLVAMVLIASTFSAQAQEKQEKVGETSYYPLAIGNTWHYKLDNTKFTMKVTKHEAVDKTMCARVELVVDNKVQAFEHIGIKTDGVFRHTYEGKKTEPPACILKLPPKTGATWEINAKVGGETLKGMLKAAEEEVKVPAGTYKAVTVSANDFDANGTKISFKYFFADNVGMVKQELDVSGQKAIIELEKFERAEPAKK